MSASYPPPANKSCRIWTERDDELPWFMADMLATAISSEVLGAAIPPEEDAVSIATVMSAAVTFQSVTTSAAAVGPQIMNTNAMDGTI